MATLQLSTASNAPTVDPTQVDELREFLDEWLIGTGSFDDITVKVEVPERDPNTGDADLPCLMLYGYTSFSPVHQPTVHEAAEGDLDDTLDEDEHEVIINQRTEELLWDYAGKHTEDFLRELLPFLTELFVVQTVGYEKCRFPHVGYQHRVDPDGEIDHIQLG